MGRLGRVEPPLFSPVGHLKLEELLADFGVLVEYRNIEHNIIKLRRLIINYWAGNYSLGYVHINRLQNIILQFCHNQLVSNNC